MQTVPYTQGWRDTIRSSVQSSAAALVPVLLETFFPTSVVDVGCGEGWFLEAFKSHGLRTHGIDGPWIEAAQHVDLAVPPYPELDRRYDMALCLEVAEHVPEEHADDLVAWLTTIAPLVVFSAAIPGQGGEGHINEQWPGYWADKFAHNKCHVTGALRWTIWDDDRISWWYRQNLLVAARDLDLLNGLYGECASVIHPGMWTHHHG